MKNLRTMLFASLLALAISSTAFASGSNINTGAPSNINTGAPSNINTGFADLMGDIFSTFMDLIY